MHTYISLAEFDVVNQTLSINFIAYNVFLEKHNSKISESKPTNN